MLHVLPAGEEMASEWLRSVDDVVELVGESVWTVLPSYTGAPAEDPRWPAVRITRIGGLPVMSDPLIADRARLQVDCFAARRGLAQQIAATCRAALVAMIGEHVAGGYCLDVTVGQLAYDPDDTREPTLPRYRFDAVVAYGKSPEGT